MQRGDDKNVNKVLQEVKKVQDWAAALSYLCTVESEKHSMNGLQCIPYLHRPTMKNMHALSGTSGSTEEENT